MRVWVLVNDRARFARTRLDAYRKIIRHCLYINLTEQPARLAHANFPLLEQWKISFGLGLVFQSSVAIAAGLAAFDRVGDIGIGAMLQRTS